MTLELIRPAGAARARRWLALLLAVPERDRDAVVDAVERQICERYPIPVDDD